MSLSLRNRNHLCKHSASAARQCVISPARAVTCVGSWRVPGLWFTAARRKVAKTRGGGVKKSINLQFSPSLLRPMANMSSNQHCMACLHTYRSFQEQGFVELSRGPHNGDTAQMPHKASITTVHLSRGSSRGGSQERLGLLNFAA